MLQFFAAVENLNEMNHPSELITFFTSFTALDKQDFFQKQELSHVLLLFQVSILLRSQNLAVDMADLTRLQRLFGLQYHLPKICPS